MTAVARVCIGLGITLAAWLLTRVAPRAWSFGRPAAVALDALAPFAGFALFVAITGRPVLSGVLVMAIFGGLALADHVKRRVLLEPVIFSDLSLLVLIVRHPALYLPYVGYWRMALAIIAILLALAGLALAEPSVLSGGALRGLAAAALGAGMIWVVANSLLQPVATLFRRLGPTAEPEEDAAMLGALAMLLTHGVIARSERSARKAAAAPRGPSAPSLTRRRRPPVVLVQAESFFDARRLHPAVPEDLLPTFERCRGSSLQWGRLDVRGRGGNTMRTEFDVLTGLSEDAVGLDWRNPYHAFARAPVDSLAWKLRAEGYRTICIHPFDKSFFARDKVMPNLGFEQFWGEEAFDGQTRDGRYIADSEVARVIETQLQDGDGLFLFAITIANHGPWPNTNQPADAQSDGVSTHRGGELAGYLKGLQRSDAMLGRIAKAIEDRGDTGLLAFFGDHLPSLPDLFAELDFHDPRTDYLLRRGGGGPALRQDVSACELSHAILRALD
jgi:hypothetical protein